VRLTHVLIHGTGVAQVLSYLAHVATGKHLTPDRLPHPKSATTLALHGFSQLDDYSCGVVAGWSVVHSFYPHKSVQRFYDLSRVSPQQGVTMANLVRALRVSGVGISYRRVVTFERLRSWINRGYPVICFVRHKHAEGGRYDGAGGKRSVGSKRSAGGDLEGHWLVVYGYRERPVREVFVAGNGWLPIFDGGHQLPWATFKRMYQHHALVCCKSDGTGLRFARPR
jgi:hypothetical protein